MLQTDGKKILGKTTEIVAGEKKAEQVYRLIHVVKKNKKKLQVTAWRFVRIGKQIPSSVMHTSRRTCAKVDERTETSRQCVIDLQTVSQVYGESLH